MRQRLYINGRFLSQRLTGVQRYAREVVRALDSVPLLSRESGSGVATLLIPRNASQVPNLVNIDTVRVGVLTGHLWEQLELPGRAYDGMLLSLANSAPVLARRQVVTIHDAGIVAFPSAYTVAFRTWYRLLFGILGRVAESVLTVSNFSKEELCGKLGIEGSKVELSTEGAEHILTVSRDERFLARRGLVRGKFVLSTGSIAPHKNFGCFASAARMLREKGYQLVVAGGGNSGVFKTSSEDTHDGLVCLGYVSDSELRTLYESAGCFVFPSWYEGFGLPPLEAMACRCPVIASDIPVLREVCGDAAAYFDPGSPEQLASLIDSLMNDGERRSRMGQRGVERAAHFSWAEAALRNARTVLSL